MWLTIQSKQVKMTKCLLTRSAEQIDWSHVAWAFDDFLKTQLQVYVQC